MITILLILAVALATGAALKLYFDHAGSDYRISWLELAVGAVVCAVLIAWPVVHIGTKLAQASAVTFKEYWSGYELETTTHTDQCHKYSDQSFGDSCSHHYRCDPYIVTRIVTVPNSDGKGTHTETRSESHWHYCPESKIEISYYVGTTLGQYTIGSHLLPPNPYQYEWDHDGKIPASLVSSAHIPAFWAAAKERIEAGKPGPVSAIKPYKNYILASQKTILKKYSGSVDGYRKQGLMPDVSKKLDFPYLGKKAYFVGFARGAESTDGAVAWTDAVNRFNVVFGLDLEGDLHLLIINANKVKNPDEWFDALNANWQSKRQGKHAIAKNALIVAVGTQDGKTIKWARASTGMPLGNEALLNQIQNDLKGQTLDPATLIGDPVAERKPGGKTAFVYGDGMLVRTVWGQNRFARVSMSCDSPGDHCVGYGYLSGEIQPSTAAKFGIFVVAVLLCLLVWGAMLAIGPIPIGGNRRL